MAVLEHMVKEQMKIEKMLLSPGAAHASPFLCLTEKYHIATRSL